MHRRLLIAGGLLLLLAAALLGLVSLLDKSELTEAISITIPKGSSAVDVADLLHAGGAIRNAYVFKLAVRIRGSSGRIQAGTYRFEPGVRMGDVLAAIEQGRTERIKVLVREGATLRMIGEVLEKQKITSSRDFLAAAADKALLGEFGIPGPTFEGYLFPDTYDFSPAQDAATVIRAMASTFFRKISGVSPEGISPGDLYSKVILASIVEREYRRADEAPVIASVFMNRLAMRMPLQSCATVVYILTEKLGNPHPDIVLYADLQLQDSYNTYRNRGLPPGPISNPGETALRAVFNPAKTDYLYFRLADGATGTHRFSRTFDEHTQAAIPVKGF